MPTIYSKNIWYYTEYPVVGNPPANKTLTLVYYNWSYPAPRPAGLTVYLCNSAVTLCADVTTVQSGSVNFTGQGVPATTPLRIYAGVSGSGTMSPLYGGTTNIVVNYQSNP
ncbi:hypothetical protein HNQ59_003668 [Chitinivorax tropicus]|uniref:Uncharacterized protein n=1 Tax=Chitinivorax tropicus TaxID=714531 RepID=A0A840MTD9_9PROT|nr:flagellar protein FlhE [Chitinivorax tropicus]MBB5020349.1 hypothetical protein [Chitinivorax tropicus]